MIAGHGYHIQTSDFLHIDFRLRVLFLTPKRQLEFFELLSPPGKPFDFAALGLRGPDVDFHEKQHWSGCLRWQGIDNNGHVVSRIIELLAKTHPAASMYWTFARYFNQIFIGDEDILVKLRKCGWCFAYLALWRWYLRRRQLPFGKAFLSDQTFQDLIIAISSFVLFVKFLRDADDADEVVAALRCVPSHLSSRFLEYLYCFCRSEHRNATSFGLYAGKVHVDHYLYVTRCEFKLGMAAPDTHRQLPKGPARLDWSFGDLEVIKTVTDARIVRLLDDGGRWLLSDSAKAHPEKPIPALGELKSEGILPRSCKKRILKHELTIIPDAPRNDAEPSVHGTGPGEAPDPDDNNDDTDGDDDDDVQTEDERERAGDEDGDEDDPVPSDAPGLRAMLMSYGLPSTGTVRSMEKAIKEHRRSRAGVEEALASAAAATSATPSSAKATATPAQKTKKQQEAEDRLIRTVQYCADAVEKEPEDDAGKLPHLRQYAKLFNSCVRKELRGRRERFIDIGMRDVVPRDDDGEPAASQARLPLLQCHNAIRLSRRLIGGGSAANLKHMCAALSIDTSGDASALRTCVELKLRSLQFEDDTTFIPTAQHLRMPLDEFNECLVSESIPLWSFDSRAGSQHGNAYRDTPWSDVRQMETALASMILVAAPP